MSTIFGVLVDPSYEIIEIDDCVIIDNDDDCENIFEPVAVRTNSGHFYWKNSIAYLLADDVKVYPIDNSRQGINTIGDIKAEILTEMIKNEIKLTGPKLECQHNWLASTTPNVQWCNLCGQAKLIKS